MMTKTQMRIMKLFTSNITREFSIQGAGKKLNMHQALSYRASKPLIEKGLITPSENNLYRLNYKQHLQELISIEYQRTVDFLDDPNHKRFGEFMSEIMENIDEEKFIFLLFGSAVESSNPRDYDILLFFDTIKKAQKYENIIINLSQNHPRINIHVSVDSMKDFRQMLKRRDEKNVVNEALNKHIIFYGADLFYLTMKRERSYA